VHKRQHRARRFTGSAIFDRCSGGTPDLAATDLAIGQQVGGTCRRRHLQAATTARSQAGVVRGGVIGAGVFGARHPVRLMATGGWHLEGSSTWRAAAPGGQHPKVLIVAVVTKIASESNCAQKAASRQTAPRLSGVLSQSRGAT
jgi:hypothetical protein